MSTTINNVLHNTIHLFIIFNSLKNFIHLCNSKVSVDYVCVVFHECNLKLMLCIYQTTDVTIIKAIPTLPVTGFTLNFFKKGRTASRSYTLPSGSMYGCLKGCRESTQWVRGSRRNWALAPVCEEALYPPYSVDHSVLVRYLEEGLACQLMYRWLSYKQSIYLLSLLKRGSQDKAFRVQGDFTLPSSSKLSFYKSIQGRDFQDPSLCPFLSPSMTHREYDGSILAANTKWLV